METIQPPERSAPFLSLAKLTESRLGKLLLASAEWCLEPVLGFRELNRVYARLVEQDPSGPAFFEYGMRAMNLKLKVTDADRSKVPATGPVVMVCNHPFGGVDGIVTGALVNQLRPDSKLLVNFLLEKIQGIGSHLISVDPFGGDEVKSRNYAGMRAALQHLKKGGLLATWPAGTVSHLHLRKRQVTDPVWAENLALLIRRTNAMVVPVYFPGRNSWFFQLAGLIHPRLRTLLLVREMVARQGTEVEVRIGQPISAARLASFPEDRQLMDFLRLKTYILKNRQVAERTSFRQRKRAAKVGEVIRAPVVVADMQADLAGLSDKHCLLRHGEFAVYYARAHQIPNILQEIGRQREITFRAVGEGTGKSIDLDVFDTTYVHLFLWNHERHELVGAYRLGLTDEILLKQGKTGLYTNTLFRYKPEVLRQLNPAIELGRSFIIESYQRRHASLGLIWRGIGHFVSRYPRYRILFGPVSISREYQTLSKNLIVQYLKEHTLDEELSGKVRARNPLRPRSFGSLDKRSFSRSVRDIEDVSALISEIEREERGVPVLLRQYLKLNATMLSFNIDPDFGDCIDGLVLVDLTKTDAKALSRYMGDEGARSFHAFHEVRTAPVAG